VAILIQIHRVADFPDAAVYEFGPVEGIIGQVSLDKATGRVELFDIAPEATGRVGFYLPRVARALSQHHAAGEYPERTNYRA
jgi:hypothetical protein